MNSVPSAGLIPSLLLLLCASLVLLFEPARVNLVHAQALAQCGAPRLNGAGSPLMGYVVLYGFDGALKSDVLQMSKDTKSFQGIPAAKSAHGPHYIDSGNTVVIDGQTVRIFTLDSW